LDVFEIVDHAHAILGPVPLIQMFQPVAWKAVTAKAIFCLSTDHLLAVLDFAGSAGFRFIAVISLAPGTLSALSNECAAEATVHPAGGDQIHGYCSRFFWAL
jgi:hypothetical protein